MEITNHTNNNKSIYIDFAINLPGIWLLLACLYKPAALLASLKLHAEPAPKETDNQHMYHSNTSPVMQTRNPRTVVHTLEYAQ